MSKRARDMAYRHFNKGVSLIEKGQHENALEILKQAAEQAKDADSPQIEVAVLQTYADLLFSQGKKEEALKGYIKAAGIVESEPDYLLPEQRANMFSNMALALENTGRKLEAGDRYTIAAQNYRDLVQKDPSNQSHIANMVSTLNNMGALFAETGKYDRAFDAFEEALGLQEGMDEETPDESSTLQKKKTIRENLLNIPLENASEMEKEKYEKLLQLYMEEAEKEGENSLKVAAILQNSAHVLEKEGQKDDAFSKLEEALRIASTFIDNEKDEDGGRKISIGILRDMNRLLEAEDDNQKLMDKYGLILDTSRKILTSAPENTSYQLNVAFSLDIIGNLLKDSGDIEGAIRNIEESVDIVVNILQSEVDDNNTIHAAIAIIEDMLALAELKEENGSKLDLYRQLGEKIGKLGQDNLELGLISADMCRETGLILAEEKRYSEALENFKKALSIYETVKHATGDDSKMNEVLKNTAKAQFDLGRYDEALISYMQLIKSGETDREFADKVDSILLELERKADHTGDVDLIGKEYDRILEIRAELLGIVPDQEGRNTGRIKEIQGKKADIMVAMGHLMDALELYEQLQESEDSGRYIPKIIKLLEKMEMSASKEQINKKLETLKFLLSKYNVLAERHPDNIQILVNKASVIDGIAYALSETGETEESGYMCNYALEAYSELAAMEPENMYPVERIAALNTRLAEIAVGAGIANEAEKRFLTSLEAYRNLMDADPCNIEYELDHAGVLDGMGAFFLNAGMYGEAKKSYENALRSYAAIMDQNPENKTYKSYVTITLENLGYVLELMGRKDDANWMYESARRIEEGA
ncbi:Tetratricopeptide repeat-containing protein [Methanolobus vulcani]|uniref:Tetratricopeptide repeat-containing protein n=1 Tax=Methanolobus vulcani TaxID=38026 RepID=A0A7Z7AVI2_9EURY|nr:tetratricopeptide repeat protein [Methanolobus vulcani]SDF51645.1 Tetratricopeptide repeat-containing protein [Methanolobus vulcani]